MPQQLEYASTCFLPTSWLPLPLIARTKASHDSSFYDFWLPPGRSLDLPVCGCLLVRAPGRGRAEGAGRDEFTDTDAVRPYTPISEPSQPGRFRLLVKHYTSGAVSEYLSGLPIGATLDFKHISFNVKEAYPFPGKEHITMLCGGTGVAPMFQALHKLLGTQGDQRKVMLVVGNKSEADILLRPELEAWAAAHPRLTVVHVLGERPDDAAPAGWAGTSSFVAEAGLIDEAKVRKYAAPPSEQTLLLVCGVPAMYKEICGGRGERELAEGSVLQRLGYSSSMVAKM